MLQVANGDPSMFLQAAKCQGTCVLSRLEGIKNEPLAIGFVEMETVK
jgi:hypothetical protein